MTFAELQQDVYRRMNHPSTPDTTTSVRVKAFLNQRHRELLSLPDCQQFRDDSATFTTVANTSRYALPQAVARIHRMWDTSNELRLMEETLSWYRTMAPNPSVQTGNPEVFVVLGQQWVNKQPTDSSVIYAKSTAAGDTTQTIYIEGLTSIGARATASVLLTGTTAVSITSESFLSVDRVYLSAAAAGAVTVHEDSGSGTELTRFYPGQLMTRYWGLYLWPTPSSAITLSFDYARHVLDMTNDTDEPLLPLDFHRALVYGACVDECLKSDDSRLSVFKTEWRQAVSDLKYFVHARASYRPGVVGSTDRSSNLGAGFPAGRW